MKNTPNSENGPYALQIYFRCHTAAKGFWKLEAIFEGVVPITIFNSEGNTFKPASNKKYQREDGVTPLHKLGSLATAAASNPLAIPNIQIQF